VLNDSSRNPIYSNAQLFRQKNYKLLAGYAEDDAADSLHAHYGTIGFRFHSLVA
jgi:hypothetical protein